jgi:hypothetical protein
VLLACEFISLISTLHRSQRKQYLLLMTSPRLHSMVRYAEMCLPSRFLETVCITPFYCCVRVSRGVYRAVAWQSVDEIRCNIYFILHNTIRFQGMELLSRLTSFGTCVSSSQLHLLKIVFCWQEWNNVFYSGLHKRTQQNVCEFKNKPIMKEAWSRYVCGCYLRHIPPKCQLIFSRPHSVIS